MTEASTPDGADPVALLVGDEAYLAAGGKIVADLFSEDGDRGVDPSGEASDSGLFDRHQVSRFRGRS